MPVPGPRNQFGPAPGYRNPGEELPVLFNRWNRPGPVAWIGRTPGLMQVTLRGCVLGYGQVRKLWDLSGNMNLPGIYDWVANGILPTRPRAVGVTSSRRYMTRSTYMGAGIDNSRYAELHTSIEHRTNYKPVTIGGGQKRSQPTVRNRMTSFGSRVPTLNSSVPAAESSDSGS